MVESCPRRAHVHHFWKSERKSWEPTGLVLPTVWGVLAGGTRYEYRLTLGPFPPTRIPGTARVCEYELVCTVHTEYTLGNPASKSMEKKRPIEYRVRGYDGGEPPPQRRSGKLPPPHAVADPYLTRAQAPAVAPACTHRMNTRLPTYYGECPPCKRQSTQQQSAMGGCSRTGGSLGASGVPRPTPP